MFAVQGPQGKSITRSMAHVFSLPTAGVGLPRLHIMGTPGGFIAYATPKLFHQK